MGLAGVLPSPEPIVLFRDFADNSLNFEVHFWLRARTMFERLKLESAMRYEICRQFQEAEIVIAFPQRDVHLDTVRPLEVRMLPDHPKGPAPAGDTRAKTPA